MDENGTTSRNKYLKNTLAGKLWANREETGDFEIHCLEGAVKADRSVLRAISPVLGKIVENQGLPSLKLACSRRHATQFLEFAYLGMISEVEMEDYSYLMSLSRRFVIPELGDYLSRHLLDRMAVDTYLDCLAVARESKLGPAYMDRMRTYFHKHISFFKSNSRFVEFTPDESHSFLGFLLDITRAECNHNEIPQSQEGLLPTPVDHNGYPIMFNAEAQGQANVPPEFVGTPLVYPTLVNGYPQFPQPPPGLVPFPPHMRGQLPPQINGFPDGYELVRMLNGNGNGGVTFFPARQTRFPAPHVGYTYDSESQNMHRGGGDC